MEGGDRIGGVVSLSSGPLQHAKRLDARIRVRPACAREGATSPARLPCVSAAREAGDDVAQSMRRAVGAGAGAGGGGER